MISLGAGTEVEPTVGVPESARLPRVVAPPREVAIAQHRAVGEVSSAPLPLHALRALQPHDCCEVNCVWVGMAGSGLR